METSISNYKGRPVSFLKLPDNHVLLKTIDICDILEIDERPTGTVIAQPCLDLASAVNLALANDPEFAMWLNETFAGFNPETSVHPKCDDNWKFQ